jgi:CBS domain-containing protein
MTRERVSSLLVSDDGALLGIVTDRDLRSRCVAAGLDGTTPLRQVMTPGPLTVSRFASAFEALLTMSRRHIHHLPVVDANELHGLVSTHDLLRAQATNPLYLADRVGRCNSIDALREAVTELRELHLQLVAAHATARQLGQAVTSVCDAVTRRLIELALEQLGDPPVAFAWLATGSQGRGELTLCSDQDNALILDDAFVPEAHGDYFAVLARSVNEGLHASGYTRCPGDVMASNPLWRQPLATWGGYFVEWLQRTNHKTVTLAANFFDLRTVWGEDSLRQRLMAEILPQCVGAKVFQAYLAGHALGNQPPLGFFRNFVVARSGAHEGMVDLKKRGLLPIVDLARLYALAGGIDTVATQQRLQDAALQGSLTTEGAETLQSAFEFIWTLRARQQASQLRCNAPLNNFVAPEALTPMERRHLKDAFAAIATMQRSLSAAHGDRLPL